MSEGRAIKELLHIADNYAQACKAGKSEKDIKYWRNKLGARIRPLCELRERLEIDEDMKKRIKKLCLSNFQDVVLRSDLDIHIPTIKDLPPEILFEMWQKMPNTTLSKEKIFTGAVALCIDYLAKESKK